MSKKLAIIIISLGVIAGLGFFVVSKNKPVEYNNPEDQTPAAETPLKPAPNPTAALSAFGKPVVLHLNKKVTFTDGLKVILTQIDDSRCSKDVKCIWAGEVAVILEVSGGKLSLPGEVHLGTVVNQTASPEDYTFTIKDGTAESATIVVEYKKR